MVGSAGDLGDFLKARDKNRLLLLLNELAVRIIAEAFFAFSVLLYVKIWGETLIKLLEVAK